MRARRLLLPAVLVAAACAHRGPPPPGPASAVGPARGTIAKGDALRRSGDLTAAVPVYRAAMEADPASVPAHLRYVAALVALGRRSEAREVYAARAAAPNATDADRTMAERLSTNGASTPLRRVYTAAAERSPNVPWWRLAVAEVEIAEADAWNRRRLDAIERGDRELEKKALAQARSAVLRGGRALDKAAEAGPVPPEGDLYRGHLRAVEGDIHGGSQAKAAAYRAAADAFRTATRRDPDLVEAWAGLGDVLYRTGEVRGALEAWREGVNRAPSDPYLRESLGIVLHQAERHAEAAEQYTEAAKLDPKNASPLLRKGDAWADAERWQEALDAYAEALQRDPSAIEAHYRSAIVLEHLGRLSEARVAYERYANLGGEHTAAVKRRIERLLRAEMGR